MKSNSLRCVSTQLEMRLPMKTTIHNFNAGPSVLPAPVMKQAQTELLDYQGSGMSVMELSHRSGTFDALMSSVESDLRQLLEIPANYKTLFLQGGASLQFSMVPMNFLSPNGSADYVLTGAWGLKAMKEARKFGSTQIAGSTESTGFDHVPIQEQMKFNMDSDYIHYTSNETIQGVQWPAGSEFPAGIPLVCDMSSDILSRPIDVSKYGLIYAGAQKNAGPSGVTLVIVRDDLLERVPENLATMLDYRLQAEKKSLFNTPPSFSIYVLGLVLRWLIGQGGLRNVEKDNKRKAELLYQAIDNSNGYYQGHAQPECRSMMNVTFRLKSIELETAFAEEALLQGFVGLRGHRSVGGIRASIYNACSLDSVRSLVEFMDEFQKKYQ